MANLKNCSTSISTAFRYEHSHPTFRKKNVNNGKCFLQITDAMVDVLANFVDSLTVELGYPCSHRRMKKYITEDGIDNHTR